MAIWPFKRRRRGQRDPSDPTSTNPSAPLLAEKAASTRAGPVSQHQSTATSSRRRATSQTAPARSASSALQWQDSEKPQTPAEKENIAPPPFASREDITALPMSYKLEQSPHLRPVDLDRPAIPYNFRPNSMSQTDVHRQDTVSKPHRPHTLRSKRSATDYAPARRTSSRLSRRRDDAVREEEIRAMSAPIPIPKRPGEGPLRRESKKVRATTGRESQVSLPPEGSVHSSMSGIMEQRGWEIGSLPFFSGRPNVRLSSTPQYVVSTSVPQSPSGVLYRIDSIRGKEKEPVSRDSARKRRVVGDEADELDTTDLRLVMERDAKRREKRDRQRQEALDRTLRSREGRNRGDSDAKRPRVEEERRAEEGRVRVEQQIQARGPLTPPTDVHPALRHLPSDSEIVPMGLGIGQQPAQAEPMDVDMSRHSDPAANPNKANHTTENPFADAAEVPATSPRLDSPSNDSNTSLPFETPLEEPVLGTAQAVRLSITHTPPLSPTYGPRITPSTSQLTQVLRAESVSVASVAELQPPPLLPMARRSSDPPQERRGTSWATFFRRGGTNRKSKRDGPASPSEGSFSNTSRESMRTQPLPAHLVRARADRVPAGRSNSGTPVRTQSKFREDLPELPISPPDSRTQSPDVIIAAGTATTARRAGPQAVDIPGRMRDHDRNDTPVSHHMRGHTAMAGSLASIGSEAEWLASGSIKRQSNQSAPSRSLGKRSEFNASYEELGGDGDVEYMSRNRSRKISNPALMGASPDEESEEEEQESELIAESTVVPPTMHGSVRRKPTLVERDPRLKSREGLVTEYAAAERVETPFRGSPAGTPGRAHSDEEYDEEDYPESPEPHAQIERATSVNYSRHSRQFSAGSARLLDVLTKRPSIDQQRRESKTFTSEPSATAGASAHE